MIKIRHLSKEFGSQVAVREIDLDIPSGQLVGLLGPNGAGKSTTIKILTGMLMPTSGTAEVGGFDVIKENNFRVMQQRGGDHYFLPHAF